MTPPVPCLRNCSIEYLSERNTPDKLISIVLFHFDGLQRVVVGTGFSKAVVRLAQAVKAQLVFAATQHPHPLARIRRQMKRIAHKREGNSTLVEQLQ